MNAYELTKELSEFMTEDKYTDLDKTIFKTCNMLRQQADEIQALKDGFNTAWGGTNNSELAEVRAMANRMVLKVEEQADRIAELSKNVDEPVAWIKKDTLIFLGNYEFGSITIQVQKQKDDEFDIPLYTTPQIKELSNEEIIEVFEKPFHKEPTGKINDEVIAFARAILKKASEK